MSAYNIPDTSDIRALLCKTRSGVSLGFSSSEPLRIWTGWTRNRRRYRRPETSAYPTGDKVSALLDGLTLEKASVIPDEIRGWDKNGPGDPQIFHYSAHPRIDEQLRAFWHANQPTTDLKSSVPSHHWFHYTDVPVISSGKYSDAKAGRSQWDIMHMIPYCLSVLKTEIPEENPRKITKAVAVILLAHYVGDIHEPLHVGTEYFDRRGQKADPDRNQSALEDQGGNTITLQLRDATARSRKFHGFWDNDVVNASSPSCPKPCRRKSGARKWK